MHPRHTAIKAFTIIALSAFCSSAYAQASGKASCVSVGPAAMEPVGDREGHAIQVAHFTCTAEGGLVDGGVMTGSNIMEFDKGGAKLLSGNGVTRKPGTLLAWEQRSGMITLTMKDGKVTGYTGEGKGMFTFASGSAAAWAGKSFTWKNRSTEPGKVMLEYTVE